MVKHTALHFALAVFLVACASKEEPKEIAERYCGSCHLAPSPDMLDKKTWAASVLPQMAFRMGFPDTKILSTFNPDDIPLILRTIPSSSMVSEEDWKKIEKYFVENAPDSLNIVHEAVTDTLTNFEAMHFGSSRMQFVTMLQYDTAQGKLFAGTRGSKLYAFNTSLKATDSALLPSTPSHLVSYGDKYFVSVMGMMDPNDQASGAIVSLDVNFTNPKILIDSLQRPVYFELGELTGDNHDDLLVCEFGNITGKLSLLELTTHKKHIISSQPGAIKAYIDDVNGDKQLDIVSLMTQGDERISLWINEKQSNFGEQILKRFSPVNGSNFIQWIDLNGDGYKDLLYTNGDNADYSAIVKPYHEVSIFLNDKKNNFRKVWSYAMPGVSQAKAADFDGDGDMDIAAISFFADFARSPEKTFLYFENNGNFKYVAKKSSVSTSGRWLVLETGDIDGDEDIDIVLGAFNFRTMGVTQAQALQWAKNRSSIVLLRNLLK